MEKNLKLDKIKYRVAEHFISINGEGAKAGQLALFIRFQGCNLNCAYCDTKWANREETPFIWMTADELAAYAERVQIDNITLTGGEPLLQQGIVYLIASLLEKGMCVEIETNGSQPIDLVRCKTERILSGKIQSDKMNRLVFTLDYKLGCSGMEQEMDLDNYRYLQAEDTVKFVAGDVNDLLRAKEVVEQYGLVGKCHVYISPVFGQIEPAEIVGFMKENHMNGVNLQLQLHKFIWDPQERGV